MSDIVVSPNMNLPVPIVGQDPGPDWANNINNCLTIIDGHNHSPGYGVQVTPAGLNINATLPFNDNNITEVMSVRFQSQGSPLSGGADLECVYVSGVDLFYNDGNGNQVQITSGGGVTGAAGNITNLTPPASVVYSSINQTFTFQSAANTPANLDVGYIILRNNVVSSKALTVYPPSAMAANFTLTLPSLPSVQSFVTLDNTGLFSAPWTVDNVSIEISANKVQVKDAGITTPKIADLNVTRPKLVAVGQQISLSCGSFSSSSTTAVMVQDQTVTITTTGRPVIVMWIPTTGVIPPQFSQIEVSGSGAAIMFVERDSNPILTARFDPPDYPPLLATIDPVSAGTHTYVGKVVVTAGVTVNITSLQLVAYEL